MPVNLGGGGRCHDADKENAMTPALTTGQREQLQTLLRQQRRALEDELRLQLDGDADRISHAQAALASQEDEAAHRVDRDVDLARSDATLQALRDIDAALARLQEPDFGHCADCDQPIPFDRLRLTPQASCCIRCQTEREHHRPVHRATL